MANIKHGTVKVQRPGGQVRTIPANHWHMPNSPFVKQGYQLVIAAPVGVPKAQEKPAKAKKTAAEPEIETTGTDELDS